MLVWFWGWEMRGLIQDEGGDDETRGGVRYTRRDTIVRDDHDMAVTNKGASWPGSVSPIPMPPRTHLSGEILSIVPILLKPNPAQPKPVT